MTRKYVAAGPDIDLEAEEIYDGHGNRIDQAYVDQAVQEVHAEVARRRAGRPSLSGPGESTSPKVAFRVPQEYVERAERVAAAHGVSVYQLAREIFMAGIDREAS